MAEEAERMAQPRNPTETSKEALREALADALRDERDMLRDVLVEALEEIGLVEAIQQGRETELVNRDEVFDLLKGAA